MNSRSQLSPEEPRLLITWEDTGSTGRVVKAAALSLGLHILAAIILLLLPWGTGVLPSEPRIVAQLRRVTPLVAPPTELTQKAPNRGQVSKELNLEGLLPKPPIYVPKVPANQPRSIAPVLTLPPAPRPATQAPSIPEPPKLEGGSPIQSPIQGLGTAPLLPAPAPQIQTEEKPKLAFEVPGGNKRPAPAPGGPKLQVPNSSVDEALRQVARRGPGGGIVVGDEPAFPGIDPLRNPPRPGRPASSLELLSDPMGVDFKPYLIEVLAAVRRNWFAVIPESAKMGWRGRVQIQFAISRDGQVPKLVIATPSGAEPLDRAAVAGISASNPFRPLPAAFRGQQIRLQFTFSYNMPVN